MYQKWLWAWNGMDKGSADNTGIPRMLAPFCQVGYLNMHSMKGSHAAERDDGYVVNVTAGALRCHGLMQGAQLWTEPPTSNL